MIDYSTYTKAELLKIIAKQEKELKTKKYGLVWDSEREPEQVVLDCENNLPLLKRLKSKEIRTDDADDNILIEGDNYHALTVLNYTHKEKIDIIYIDPPYNTKQEGFLYNDRRVDQTDGYRHSKWLNFIEKRLNLAKGLLKETGVIFISIDDNEVYQLKLICDKIFSEKNFIGTFSWEKKKKGSYLDESITNVKEYILTYSANKNKFSGLIGEITDKKETYPCVNPGNKLSIRKIAKGVTSKYKKKNFILNNGEVISAGNMSLKLKSDLIIKNGVLNQDLLIEAEWRYSQESIDKFIKFNELYITTKLYFRRIVSKTRYKKLKDFLPRIENNRVIALQDKLILELRGSNKANKIAEIESEIKLLTEPSYLYTDFNNLYNDGWGSNEDGDNELRNLFGKKVFDYPKPTKLIAKLIASVRNDNAIILDFMAGSGTTGHSVLEVNKSIGVNYKFILCTNNEKNICTSITYPRIKKVIEGYKKRGNGEQIDGLNGNLQYFKTSLLKKTNNRDQVKINLTQKCTEMLCVKENIFNVETEEKDFKIFSSNKKDRFLCVYYNFIEDSFNDFVEELQKLESKKNIYMFSMENQIDKSFFSGLKNFTIEVIPQNILDVYKQLVKMNIPIKPNVIFTDLNKAKTKIFVDKDKDDSARVLRVVLEKLIQRISQNNSINILNAKGKELKISTLNDSLFNQNIITKIEWEENSTYLTIGNNAAHGDYDDYDIKQVIKFYKHIQSLLNNYNV